MSKFPVDAPLEQVIQALQRLGFHIVLTQSGISREEFLEDYEKG